MRIAILIFDQLTALDAIGPYEVLSRLPGAELEFVATEPGIKRTAPGRLGLEATKSLGELADPEIDMVLHLAREVAGEEAAQAIQLSIEYDPEPPFDAGSPSKAPAAIVDRIRNVERAPLEHSYEPSAANEHAG